MFLCSGKKIASHWLFGILCLQHHFWPALIDQWRRIKTFSACVCWPAGNLKLGEARSDSPRASEGYLSPVIQPSTASSAQRPSHCSSQGGRFVWNDILGIRRIAEEQDVCSWASRTHRNENFRKNSAGEKQAYFIVYLLFCRWICSRGTSAELHLSRFIPGLFPCSMFSVAAVMEVVVRACRWRCGWMTKWDHFFCFCNFLKPKPWKGR